jgi:hypothetical protein
MYHTLKRQNNLKLYLNGFSHIIVNTLYTVFTIYTKVTNNIVTLTNQ